MEVFDGCLGMAQNKMAKPSRLSRQALYTSLKEVRIYEGVTSRLVRLKFILDFSSWSFGIRVNLLVLSWCIITSSLFFYLTK